MGTHCQIIFENTDVKVYKHYDGYPEYVIPILKPFFETFYQRRGYDTEYLAAQVVRAFATAELLEMLEVQIDKHSAANKGMSRDLIADTKASMNLIHSWDIGVGFYSILSYIYKLTPDGTIEIYKPKYFEEEIIEGEEDFYDNPCLENATLIETIDCRNPKECAA